MVGSWLLVVIIGLIVLVGAGVATLIVVLVRRNPPRYELGPVAAPGSSERRADAARLVSELDEAAARADTALDFARLQLSGTAPDELAAAITEARASAVTLATTVATTAGAEVHGPAGTQAAGQLTTAWQRAEAAATRLRSAERRVQHEARRLDPPATH